MKKTILILILSVFITVLAAACGEQEVALSDVSAGAETAGSLADRAETGAVTGAEAEDAALNASGGTGAAGTTVAGDPSGDQMVTAETVNTASAAANTGTICVYVCGEVVTPGVYELAAGARIYEAVMLAGGMTDEADSAVINQAEPVTDSMMIRIPAKGSEEAVAAEIAYAAGQVLSSDGTALVDINTADASALTTLPGIGESKAAAIIAYRQEHGRFTATEDLRNVSGIGDSTYERLAPLITVTP